MRSAALAECNFRVISARRIAIVFDRFSISCLADYDEDQSYQQLRRQSQATPPSSLSFGQLYLTNGSFSPVPAATAFDPMADTESIKNPKKRSYAVCSLTVSAPLDTGILDLRPQAARL